MGELKVHNNVFSSSLPPPPPLGKGQEKGTIVNKTSSVEESKPKKKICCACPDTKKLRDECIVEHGEEACGKWIDAHRRCLRAEGFNV